MTPATLSRPIYSLLIAVFLLTSCRSGLVGVSKRDIQGLTRQGQLVGKKRDPIDSNPARPKAPQIFVRKKKVNIVPTKKINTTGSLMNLHDERNFFFTTSANPSVGSFLTVKVDSMRVASSDAKSDTQSAGATGASTPNGNGNKASGAKDTTESAAEFAKTQKEILASLPNLEPADGEASLVQELQMEVTHRYANGDLGVMMRRDSIRQSDGRSILVRARVPNAVLVSDKPITTKKLAAIHWTESVDGELIERHSTNWEDEYTARISGFTESASKQALELDEKRQRLADAKVKVEDQLKSIGNERQLLAKERDEAAQRYSESSEKIDELGNRIDEKESIIEDQKAVIQEKDDQIKELLQAPEDKPGDKKEGSGGA